MLNEDALGLVSADLHRIAQKPGLAIDLNAVVQELFEGGGVHDTILNRVAAVNNEFERGFACWGLLAGDDLLLGLALGARGLLRGLLLGLRRSSLASLLSSRLLGCGLLTRLTKS